MLDKFSKWMDKKDDGFFMNTIKMLVAIFILFAFYFIAFLIWNCISGFYKWCRWQMCYFTKHCVAKEFLGKKYPAKTTSEFDYKIANLFDEPVVIFNVKSDIIHRDNDCKAAKLCTENCIYLPESIANSLLKDNLAEDCKYEFYTRKNCERKCTDLSDKLENYCISDCIDKEYEDIPFDRQKFIEEVAEESLPDEWEDDDSGEDYQPGVPERFQ